MSRALSRRQAEGEGSAVGASSPKAAAAAAPLIFRGLVLSLALSALSFLFFRHLGSLIALFEGKGGIFSAVFGQLRTARILPPLLSGWALAMLLLLLLRRLPRRVRSLCAVLGGILLFLLILLLTRVNGILSFSVIRSLIRNLTHGLPDVL